MKFVKSLAVLSLSSLFTLNVVHAAEPNPNVKPQSQVQPTKKTADKHALQAKDVKKVADKKAEKPVSQKEAKKVEKTASPAKEAKKGTEAKPVDNLKEFNRNVGLKFTQRGIMVDKDNKPIVTLSYEIENRGPSHIKAVTWIGAFMLNNQAIFVQEIPLTFKKPLAPKAKEALTINVPLEKVPEQSRQYFLSKEANIGVLNAARTLTFSNGKRLEVE